MIFKISYVITNEKNKQKVEMPSAINLKISNGAVLILVKDVGENRISTLLPYLRYFDDCPVGI